MINQINDTNAKFKSTKLGRPPLDMIRITCQTNYDFPIDSLLIQIDLIQNNRTIEKWHEKLEETDLFRKFQYFTKYLKSNINYDEHDNQIENIYYTLSDIFINNLNDSSNILTFECKIYCA